MGKSGLQNAPEMRRSAEAAMPEVSVPAVEGFRQPASLRLLPCQAGKQGQVPSPACYSMSSSSKARQESWAKGVQMVPGRARCQRVPHA